MSANLYSGETRHPIDQEILNQQDFRSCLHLDTLRHRDPIVHSRLLHVDLGPRLQAQQDYTLERG
jgi:hypothetical protein